MGEVWTSEDAPEIEHIKAARLGDDGIFEYSELQLGDIFIPVDERGQFVNPSTLELSERPYYCLALSYPQAMPYGHTIRMVYHPDFKELMRWKAN